MTSAGKRKRRDCEEEEEEAGPSPFDAVPEGPLKTIFSFVAPKRMGSLWLVLRLVCPRWYRLAAVEKYERRDFGKLAETREDRKRLRALHRTTSVAHVALLFDGAETGSVSLCELALKWRHDRVFAEVFVRGALYLAARFGHLYVCQKLRNWAVDAKNRKSEATGLRTTLCLDTESAIAMCRGAAEGGQVLLCTTGITWNNYEAMEEGTYREEAFVPKSTWKKVARAILRGGAFGGHENVVDLALGMGAEPSARMLLASAKGGNTAMFLKAHAMTAYLSLNQMAGLKKAAKRGHDNICQIIMDQAPISHMNTMLHGVFISVLDWGPAPSVMLVAAAKGGQERLCKIAKDRGASNFSQMKIMAKRKGHEGVARLAQEWEDGVQ